MRDRLFSAESLAGGGGFLTAATGRAATVGGDTAFGFSSTGVFFVGDGGFAGSGTGS